MAKKDKKPNQPKKAAADGLMQVTAKIDSGEDPPSDLMTGFQIDSKPLTLRDGEGRARMVQASLLFQLQHPRLSDQ